MRRLKILIWHIHGSYLNTLARLPHDWYLPVKWGFNPSPAPPWPGPPPGLPTPTIAQQGWQQSVDSTQLVPLALQPEWQGATLKALPTPLEEALCCAHRLPQAASWRTPIASRPAAMHL